MKLTKRKEGSDYRVVINGKDSPIYINKGDAPRFGAPQEWDVCIDGEYHDFLFSASGLAVAMSKLEKLAAVFAQ